MSNAIDICDGTVSLHRLGGYTFQMLRKPGEFAGHYRILRPRVEPAAAAD